GVFVSFCILCPCSDTTITLAPISYKKSLCCTNSFFTSSKFCVVINELNQALATSSSLISKYSESSFVFLGYLLPISVPSNPANAISLIHCSNVFCLPSSGISSFVQAIGAQPHFIIVICSPLVLIR